MIQFRFCLLCPLLQKRLDWRRPFLSATATLSMLRGFGPHLIISPADVLDGMSLPRLTATKPPIMVKKGSQPTEGTIERTNSSMSAKNYGTHGTRMRS